MKNPLLSCFVGSPAVIELLPEKLEAILIPDQGYHQIGPADHCSDMFILSVTLAFATKLEQVGMIPSSLSYNQSLLQVFCVLFSVMFIYIIIIIFNLVKPSSNLCLHYLYRCIDL